MLRGNAKIWAIVVLICVIAQFFTMSLPGIIETFDQMDVEFERRAEEERAKATEPAADNTIVDTKESGHVEIEKVDNSGEVVEDESTTQDEVEENGSTTAFLIVIGVFFLLMFLFLLA